MNFYLKNIELNIDDRLVEQAEQVLKDAHFSEPVEIEKQLWLARLNSNPVQEVEVQLSGKKVKDYTCDCNIFKTNRLCPHVVAMLLDLRRRLQEKEAIAKLTKKTTIRLPQRLTVSNVLNKAKTEELRDFISNYARDNKKFALSLKARFAGNISVEDNQLKYAQLIDATMRSERGTKGTISKNKLKPIRRIFEDLVGHAGDAISLKNYSEAFCAVKAAFEKTQMIYNSFEEDETAFSFINPFIQILSSLSEKIKAPDLKREFLLYCQDKALNETIIKFELYEPFLNILFKEIKSEKEEIEMNALLSKILKQPDLTKKDKLNINRYQLQLLLDWASPPVFQKKLKLLQKDISLLLGLLQKVVSQRQFPLAIHIIDGIDREHLSKKNIRRINDLRLEVATQQNERETIQKISKMLFLESYDFKYYDLFKSSLNRTEKQQIKKIIKFLEATPASDKRFQALATIYYKEGAHKKLLNLLEESQSLDLLQQFDKELLKSHEQEVYQLYSEGLVEYLQDHLGQPASINVRKILQHLHQQGAGSLARKLTYQLRKQYAWRRSLIEELEMF